MEKREYGALEFVFRMFMTAALTVIVIVMLLIGTCVYLRQSQLYKGRNWCESVISEYEADREKFLAQRP